MSANKTAKSQRNCERAAFELVKTTGLLRSGLPTRAQRLGCAGSVPPLSARPSTQKAPAIRTHSEPYPKSFKRGDFQRSLWHILISLAGAGGLACFVAGLCGGCSEHAATIEVNRICRSLHSLTNNEIAIWFRAEIASHSLPMPGTPAQIEIRELPDWVKNLFGNSPPRAKLFLRSEEGKSYIDLIWAHGRGAAGVQIGGDSFKPTLSEEVFFVKQCEPGVFVYSPRQFP